MGSGSSRLRSNEKKEEEEIFISLLSNKTDRSFVRRRRYRLYRREGRAIWPRFGDQLLGQCNKCAVCWRNRADEGELTTEGSSNGNVPMVMVVSCNVAANATWLVRSFVRSFFRFARTGGLHLALISSPNLRVHLMPAPVYEPGE